MSPIFDQHGSDGADGAAGAARTALAAWDAFPAAAPRRPLVLVGSAVFFSGAFPTDGAKQAFLHRRFHADRTVPDDVLAALNPAAPAAPDDALPRLRIVGGTKGAAAFVTDRGEVDLPAWRLTLADIAAPLWVLDPGVATSCWRPPGIPATMSPLTASVAADDRTLTVRVFPVPDGADPAGPVRAFESAHAVALVVPGAGQVPDRATTVLATPLGGRVVVDAADGTPVPVLRHSPAADTAPSDQSTESGGSTDDLAGLVERVRSRNAPPPEAHRELRRALPDGERYRFALRLLADQYTAYGEPASAAATSAELLRHLSEVDHISRDDCFAIARTARGAGDHGLELRALQAWERLLHDREPSHGEAVALAMAFFTLASASASSSPDTARAALAGGEAASRHLTQRPDALVRLRADIAARLSGRS